LWDPDSEVEVMDPVLDVDPKLDLNLIKSHLKVSNLIIYRVGSGTGSGPSCKSIRVRSKWNTEPDKKKKE
jgi:hypothetical protein